MQEPLPGAIRSSLQILRTHLWMSGQPTGTEGSLEERISRVLDAFDEAGARWTLIGAHAVGMLTEPRATTDFDFVIEGPKLRGVVRALERALGDLDAEDIGAAVRLRAVDVDLIRSTSHALFREALTDAEAVERWRIPTPELLIALTFLSAVSPWRGRERRAQDIVDLMAIYRATGPAQLDRGRMLSLASQVYPGAEREFGDLLERIDRGEPISI